MPLLAALPGVSGDSTVVGVVWEEEETGVLPATLIAMRRSGAACTGVV
jgi:hypothetical protein